MEGGAEGPRVRLTRGRTRPGQDRGQLTTTGSVSEYQSLNPSGPTSFLFESMKIKNFLKADGRAVPSCRRKRQDPRA